MKKIILITSVFALFFNFGCMKKTDNSMRLEPEKGDTIAILSTDLGDINLLLYEDKAPETVKNFVELAKQKKYDGVIFHRVIDNFMVQTGDFENSNGTGGYSYKGPGTSLKDEFGDGLKHLKGAVSMANAGPDTGGSQFFIVTREGGTDWLNGAHAIFGYVYEGLGVAEEIESIETDLNDRPLEDVKINSVEISTYE